MVVNLELANFWVNVVLAFMTFLAAFVALMGKQIISGFNRPKLFFGISNQQPHLIQGITNNLCPIWYFRLRIKNKGNSSAKNCYVRINSVTAEDETIIDYFEPSNLKWSGAPRDMNYHNDSKPGGYIFRELKDIPPKGWEFCDLFETLGDTSFSFICNGKRPHYNILPNNYLIEVEIFGDNIKPKKVKFKLSQKENFPLIKIKGI